MHNDDRTLENWREQKKNKTKAAIQREALQLFREQGYSATTAEQIAEAAEVSRATFFRYFPTKADIVLYDVFASKTLARFLAMPAEMKPLRALQHALLKALDETSVEEREQERQREALLRTEPELRKQMPDLFARRLPLVAEALAERLGRPHDDLEALVLAGAVVGIAMALWTVVEQDLSEGFIERHVALLNKALVLLAAVIDRDG
ncbi:hypothetical protein KSD_69860 [Ktedonobacter sp. SOSP1-85]|uniref:TetR family transcriptional regulator n=1 Tax=Ktedonobacter sp. SOSP1-85 TaxID=2778367 RepID=UPI0019156916|nr:TetR family transcriptional regulator [Ktedonobacter sp. SOSP1-85]GHO79215.1 hypothetical protein KSD_69860 [Ktedonobacter sp. SOSP1-85]